MCAISAPNAQIAQAEEKIGFFRSPTHSHRLCVCAYNKHIYSSNGITSKTYSLTITAQVGWCFTLTSHNEGECSLLFIDVTSFTFCSVCSTNCILSYFTFRAHNNRSLVGCISTYIYIMRWQRKRESVLYYPLQAMDKRFSICMTHFVNRAQRAHKKNTNFCVMVFIILHSVLAHLQHSSLRWHLFFELTNITLLHFVRIHVAYITL